MKKRVIFLAAIITLSSGCSVALKPPNSSRSLQANAVEVGVKPQADGLEKRVGSGTFTLFAIPIMPIYFDGDGAVQVMQYVHSALHEAGHRSTTVDAGTSLQTPFLACKVEKFYFRNYTWAWPLAPTWGEVKLGLQLTSRDGRNLWSRSFSGDGWTLNWTDGFSLSANESMNEVYADMIREFSTREFLQALQQP